MATLFNSIEGQTVTLLRFVALLASAVSLHAAAPENRLVTYPAPGGVPLNGDFTVTVRTPGQGWQNVVTYLFKVDAVRGVQHTPLDTSVAYFDFSGTVKVSVTSNRGAILSARVRPLSY